MKLLMNSSMGKKTFTSVVALLLIASSLLFGVQVSLVSAPYPNANLTGYIEDWVEDRNGDGYPDLTINVQVNVSSAGDYIVEITKLLDPFNNTIFVGDWNLVWLDPGTQMVDLWLDGWEISNQGFDPTKIFEIHLCDGDWNVIDKLGDVALIRTYGHNEFRWHSDVAYFTCNADSWGLDTDNDTLYNYLILSVEVNVTKPGWYILRLNDLFGEDGMIPFGKEERVWLELGIRWVDLQIYGGVIYQSKVNNVTWVGCFDLYDENWNQLDRKEGVSLNETYYWWQFNEPPAYFTCVVDSWGLDTDNDTLYNYLIVSIEVNVTEAGNYILELHGLYGEGGGVGVWAQERVWLDPGIHWVDFTIEGVRIHHSMVNITRVEKILLWDEDWMFLDQKWEVDLGVTYYWRQFEAAAYFTCVISDEGVDTDGSGLYDWLRIGVEINVTEAGWYEVYASGLKDNREGHVWVYDQNRTWLDVGIQTVYLYFYGPQIWRGHIEVSMIDYVELRSDQFGYLGSKWNASLSKPYDYTEFDSPFTMLDVNLVVGPDGKVEADGMLNATHIEYPPGFTEYVDYSIERFNENYWWSNGTWIFYLPEEGLPIPSSPVPVNPNEFPLNSTYVSYYEQLSEDTIYGNMNLTVLFPPVASTVFPFNATDLEVVGEFDGTDFDGSVHGTMTQNMSELMLILGVPFGLNESASLPLRLSLNYSKGEYNGTLTLYLTEGIPLEFVTADINGNLSAICVSGTMDAIYGEYPPPIEMNVTLDWLNQMADFIKQNANETIYNATWGRMEVPYINITVEDFGDGATVTFEACIREVKEYRGFILWMLIDPVYREGLFGMNLTTTQAMVLVNVLNHTLHKIQNASLELTYTPSDTLIEFWLDGTIHVRDILKQALEPIEIPPEWRDYLPPEINSTTSPCIWTLLSIINATIHSFDNGSLSLLYSSNDMRLDLNMTYYVDYNTTKHMQELMTNLQECTLPMPPMPPGMPEPPIDLIMGFLNETDVEPIWYEVYMSYANGIVEQRGDSLLEGDFNKQVEHFKRTFIELVRSGYLGSPPPPSEEWKLDFLDETQFDFSDFNLQIALEDISVESEIRFAFQPPTDPINETSFKLERLFSLFYGFPLPDATSQVRVRIGGGCNATNTVSLFRPVTVAEPDEADTYGRYMIWDNVSLYDLRDIVYNIGAEALTVWTDRPTYTWRENVNITARFAWARPVEGANVAIQVNYPNGSIWLLSANETEINGETTFSFRIPQEAPTGEYVIYATAYKPGVTNATAQTTFLVQILIPEILIEYEKVGNWENNTTLGESTLISHVRNTGNGTAYNLDVALKVPDGTLIVIDSNLENLTDLVPGDEVTLWVTFYGSDDGFFTFETAGSYYDSARDETFLFSSTFAATIVHDFLYPVGIISYSWTRSSIDFNITLYNYGATSVNATVILTALDPQGYPVTPVIQYVIMSPEETKHIILSIEAPLSGTYQCQIILVTELPSNGGYCVEYATQAVT